MSEGGWGREGPYLESPLQFFLSREPIKRTTRISEVKVLGFRVRNGNAVDPTARLPRLQDSSGNVIQTGSGRRAG